VTKNQLDISKYAKTHNTAVYCTISTIFVVWHPRPCSKGREKWPEEGGGKWKGGSGDRGRRIWIARTLFSLFCGICIVL